MQTNHKLTLALAAIAVFAAGCGNDKEVSYKSAGMTHTFAEGKDAVPKDFALPLYPGAQPTGSVSAEGDGNEQSKYVILSTIDPIDKVSDFYQDELKKQGWTLEPAQTMPKLISISGTLKGLDSNVMISDDGGKTTISLQLNRSVETKKEDEETNENFTPDKVTPPTD
jgi:hypothetical protein